MYRPVVLIIALVTFAILLAPTASPALAAPSATQGDAFAFYPQTGHNVGMQIKQYFDANGGIDVFGLPLTELFKEDSGLQVQYFERARFELNPAASPDQRLSLTRLGAILTEGPRRTRLRLARRFARPSAYVLPRVWTLPRRCLRLVLANSQWPQHFWLPDLRGVPGVEPNRRAGLPCPVFRARPL